MLESNRSLYNANLTPSSVPDLYLYTYAPTPLNQLCVFIGALGTNPNLGPFLSPFTSYTA